MINKYYHYLSLYKKNIFPYIKKYLLSLYNLLYKAMIIAKNNIILYNKNVRYHYTSSRIMRNILLCIREMLLSLYIFLYNEK